MTQSIETLAREIAADVWEETVRRRRKQEGRNIDENWIRSTRDMFMRGVYDGDPDYIAALAGIKLGREQAAEIAAALDSDRGNEKEIAQAIRALP